VIASRSWRAIAVALVLAGCGKPPLVTIPAPAADAPAAPTGKLRAGASRVDITPPVGLGLLGWGPEGKRATGWRQRLYARTLVLEDSAGRRLALVAVDLAHVSRLLVHRVAERTATLGLGVDRLLISATHTHSAPGHFHGYAGYDDFGSAVGGYDAKVVEFLADGIARSVTESVQGLEPARAAWGADTLWGCTRIRSFVAYKENPPVENPFPDETKIGCEAGSQLNPQQDAVDPTLTVLRVDGARPIAAWLVFAIHGTVISYANELYDADVQGAVARGLERWARDSGGADTGFVAIVANGASGDVTPDLPVDRRCRAPTLEPDRRPLGPRSPRAPYIWWRPESDEAFDLCRWLDFDNLYRVGNGITRAAAGILGRMSGGPESADWRLATAFAVTSFEEACAEPKVGGPTAVGAEGGRTRYVPRGKAVQQPGDFAPNRWKVLGLFDLGFDTVYARPEAKRNKDDCQFPKHQGLAEIGRVIAGSDAFPPVAAMLVAGVGPKTLVALPFEVTTTSGRRIRNSVATRTGSQDVTIIGLANGYNSYMATAEEYSVQSYEGSSTLYGPKEQEVVARRAAALAAQMEAGLGDTVPALTIRPGKSHDRIDPAAASTPRGKPKLEVVKWVTDSAHELQQTRIEHTLRVEWSGVEAKRYAPGGRATVAVERVRDGMAEVIAWDDEAEVEVRSLGGRRWEARWRPAEAVEGSCRVRVLGDSPEGDAVSEPIPCHPDDPLSFEDNGDQLRSPEGSAG
jgi:neutral ceramidase